MYLTRREQPLAAGHVRAGVTAAATGLFAEGETETFLIFVLGCEK